MPSVQQTGSVAPMSINGPLKQLLQLNSDCCLLRVVYLRTPASDVVDSINFLYSLNVHSPKYVTTSCSKSVERRGGTKHQKWVQDTKVIWSNISIWRKKDNVQTNSKYFCSQVYFTVTGKACVFLLLLEVKFPAQGCSVFWRILHARQHNI